jgi:hypothetical protein
MLLRACAGCGDRAAVPKGSPLIRKVIFPYQCRLGALTYWSATGRSAIRFDQVLRRSPTESRLGILLSQASHFQKRADPANAMGIFPKELRRAQFRFASRKP